MKSRFFFLTLCLAFSLATFAPVSAEEKAADSRIQSAMAKFVIPAVPDSESVEDYQKYIDYQKETFSIKIQDLILQARNSGVNIQSAEFFNSLKEKAKEYYAHIEQAADKALALKDVSDEDFEKLVETKIQLIEALTQLSNEEIDVQNAKLEAFAAQLRKMGKEKYIENVENILFKNKVQNCVQTENVEEFKKLADDVFEKVEKAGKDIAPNLAKRAMLIVFSSTLLSEYNAPEGRQEQLYKALTEASDPEVNKLADELENTIRRIKAENRFKGALGKEFKFGGTFTDGSEYKAENYAGKVVLIDFWATWCGPCRAELPNVKKMYKAYHDKGFEVIGVTCDNPKAEDDFNQFLKDNHIPWKQMFDEKAVVPGEKTKDGEPVTVSDYYGINGIPCPVLIGKDGKVVSLNARGEELKEQLVKIYGEVEGLDADDEEDAVDDEDADEEVEESKELNDEDKPQAANDALPPVPQNATNDELEEYVNNLQKKALKEGIYLQYGEYKDSTKERAIDYYNHVLQAMDEAVVLKGTDDDNYERLVQDKLIVLGFLAKLNNDSEETFNAKLNEFKKQLLQINKPKCADIVEFKILKGKLEKLVSEMREKAEPIIDKARKDGIDENSPEYVNLLKGIVDEYFGPAEQLMDKALLLKYTPDRDFEDIVSEKLSMLISLAHFKNEDLTTVFSRMQPVIDQLRQLGRTECADFIEIKVLDRIFILTENADAFTKAADKLDQMVEKAGKNISWEMANAVMGMISYSRKHNYSVPEERLTKYANAFSESSNMIVKRFGNSLKNQLFENTVNSYMQNGNVEEFSKLAAEMDEAVEKAGNDISELLANQAKAILINGYKLPGYKVPKEREEKYLNAFNEAFDGDIRRLAGELKKELIKVKAQKKFYDALGAEFKFGGTFTDGSEYKAEDYAGKVVLIDFWATWCGPCRRELTNVKKMYDAYHDKGFEVIGVTCDNPTAEEEFNKFLKENDILWKQMFNEKAIVPGEKDKDDKPVLVSQYYGIHAIPCPVLIGADGKVVSLNARGEELEQQLVKIYGEVEEAAPAEETPAEPAAEESASETTSGVIVSEGVNDESESEKDDAAEEADDAIPAVPENGTLEDYQECIIALKASFQKKTQSMIAQARKDGVNPQSEEFSKSLKGMAKEYFARIEQAADKAMLLKDISDEDFEEMAGNKLQIIQITAQISEEDESAVNAKLEAFAAQLRKLGKTKLADNIEGKLIQNKIIGYIRSGNVEEFSKIAAETDEEIEKAGKDITPPLAIKALLIVLGAKDLAEYKAPEDRQAKYLKALSEASDPDVKKMADQLERSMLRAEAEKRFNDSLGKEFKFGGTFTDGSEYNAKDYAGKVVLIDFWATWCGPCCRELPNVKKMYDAYHDKGFEVIGVTLDDPKEEEDFNKFLKEKGITWKQMFDGKAVVPGMKTKTGEPILVSEYYGINAIPCPVLIGKDGKVLSLNARSAELKKQLVKAYGEVEGLDANDEEDPEVLDVYDDEDAEEEDDADEEDDLAADEPIPDVPEEGSLADYKEYVKKVNVLLNKKIKSVIRQAKKDGVNPQSEEYANLLKSTAKEYFSRIEQATDKAMLLKDLSDDELAELVGAKVQLIQIVTNLNDDKIDVVSAKLQAIADQLRKMGKEEFAKDIEDSILRTKLHNYVQTNNVEEFAKAAAVVDEKVKNAGKDITQELARLALLVVMGSKELSEYKAPEGRNDNYLKAFAEASDPEVQKFVDVLKTVINQKDDE